jgi:chemotaxis signal transduction protein
MSRAGELQVVEFGLGREVFAVPVTLVREILGYAASGNHRLPYQPRNPQTGRALLHAGARGSCPAI